MKSKDTKSNLSRIGIFVRHGQSEANIIYKISTDLDANHLTETGREQAEEAGKELEKIPKIDKLYTSPILRTRETADIISKHIKIKPEITDLLLERSFGKHNNKIFESVEHIRKNKIAQIAARYPDYESWGSMKERIGKFSEKIGSGEIAVAVSHKDPIRVAVSCVLGRDETQMLNLSKIFGSDADLSNGSLTIIDFSKEGKEAILAVGGIKVPEQLRIPDSK